MFANGLNNKRNDMNELRNIIAKIDCSDEDKNKAYDELCFLFGVSNSFISVGEKEPPKNIELLVQSPEGQNYLASWREAYNIFTCQNKGEDSFDWKWKEI
jgi:hypothetical protein